MLRSARHRCLAVTLAIAFAAPLPALAQQQQAAAARYELSLPEQDLADTLRALGKAAHVNIAFEPAAVAGRRAPALPSGQYTPDEALERLLAGSGLVARRTPGGSYAIELPSAQAAAQPQPGETATTLERVEVISKVKGFSATRADTDLKDTPQSVTVISQQTLREQNANDLSTALNWAPGISLEQQSSSHTTLTSRGFGVTTLHIDGGAPLVFGVQDGQVSRVDLSQYENIELLRGADALFGGIGDPGGSINLARKRPLDRNAVSLTASAGSWDTYRVEADLSGKLSDDGRLRGRMVMVHDDQHYFYRIAQRRMNKLYAVGEYALQPRTRIVLGGAIERTPDHVQVTSGLPRYLDGSDPRLPRSTALTLPWAKTSADLKEGFLQLEHAFNERWKLKAGLTGTEQVQRIMAPSFASPINPVTGRLEQLENSLYSPRPYVGTVQPTAMSLRQTSADLTLAGSFDWNGRKQEIVLGGDASRRDAKLKSRTETLDGPPVDPFRFDPSVYPQPAGDAVMLFDVNSSSREHGAFANVRLRPADGWAITAGARKSFARSHSFTQMTMGPQFENLQLPPMVSDQSVSGLITPFLGVVYDLSPAYSLYASYADTSKGVSVHRAVGGKLLPPQRGTNKEVGVKAAWGKGRLNGSLALFDIRKVNIPVQFVDPDPRARPDLGCCYVPTTARSKGFDAELSGRLAPGWQLGAGYTFNVNRAGDGGALSSVTPKHLLKLWTNYRLPGAARAWDLGGGITAQSGHYKEGEACPAVDPKTGSCTTSQYGPFRFVQGGYMVATLRAGYRFNESWNLALNVDNLFDRRYYQTVGFKVDSGNWYGAPRNWMLTLRGEL